MEQIELREIRDKMYIILKKTENKIVKAFAGDNIRLLLASTVRILSSGHLKFYRSNENDEVQVELHDFIRTLMLGTRAFFMPPEYDDECEVINLNGSPYSFGNNLIRFRILEVMKRGRKLLENMTTLGYDKGEAIKILAENDILESSELGGTNRSLRFMVFTENIYSIPW